MIEPGSVDSPERAELTEQDLAIAALVGRYIERREDNEACQVHDLLAVAAEFGDGAVDALRTLLVCYEGMRAYGDDAAGVQRQAP